MDKNQLQCSYCQKTPIKLKIIEYHKNMTNTIYLCGNIECYQCYLDGTTYIKMNEEEIETIFQLKKYDKKASKIRKKYEKMKQKLIKQFGKLLLKRKEWLLNQSCMYCPNYDLRNFTNKCVEIDNCSGTVSFNKTLIGLLGELREITIDDEIVEIIDNCAEQIWNFTQKVETEKKKEMNHYT